MAMHALPRIDRLRQLFTYDPKSGVLTWNERPVSSFRGATPGKQRQAAGMWNKRCAGKPAGSAGPDGYILIKIDDIPYLAHRLIWAMVYGQWPNIIDHRNGRPGDNRLRNLRDGDNVLNQRNQKRHSRNTSGRTGVSWNKIRGCWTAQIKMHDVSYNLGGFDRFEDAVEARVQAEILNGFTGRQ